MRAEQGLFEGGTDPTALQRLRRSVVVHHAAWSFSVSREQEAAEHGHLMRERRETQEALSGESLVECKLQMDAMSSIHLDLKIS